MSTDDRHHSWNDYSDFLSFGKKISLQDEHGKGFQSWTLGGKVKVYLYLAKCFIRKKS